MLSIQVNSLEESLHDIRGTVLRVLHEDGYVLREPAKLRYSLLIEDHPKESITATITEPIQAKIRGEWEPGIRLLTFQILELTYQIVSGQCPLSGLYSPPASVSRSSQPAMSASAPTQSYGGRDGRFRESGWRNVYPELSRIGEPTPQTVPAQVSLFQSLDSPNSVELVRRVSREQPPTTMQTTQTDDPANPMPGRARRSILLD